MVVLALAWRPSWICSGVDTSGTVSQNSTELFSWIFSTPGLPLQVATYQQCKIKSWPMFLLFRNICRITFWHISHVYVHMYGIIYANHLFGHTRTIHILRNVLLVHIKHIWLSNIWVIYMLPYICHIYFNISEMDDFVLSQNICRNISTHICYHVWSYICYHIFATYILTYLKRTILYYLKIYVET